MRQSVVIARHLNAVLLSSWAVYVYRDVWPLATVTLQPLDASEGCLFWVSFALLTIAGAAIPLVIPHPYIPLDPAVRQTGLWDRGDSQMSHRTLGLILRQSRQFHGCHSSSISSLGTPSETRRASITCHSTSCHPSQTSTMRRISCGKACMYVAHII